LRFAAVASVKKDDEVEIVVPVQNIQTPIQVPVQTPISIPVAEPVSASVVASVPVIEVVATPIIKKPSSDSAANVCPVDPALRAQCDSCQ
jgi:hypothetical protein